MSATPIPATAGHRYIPPGYRQYYWVDSIADKTAPTRSELDAGMDLTAEIGDLDGFTVSTDTVDAPDLGSRFTNQVPGMISADDSSLSLYLSKDDDGKDARTLLTRDMDGYVVQFPEGDVGGSQNPNLMNVFPATVTASSIQTSMDDPAMVQVSFTITAEPAQNVAVPSSNSA